MKNIHVIQTDRPSRLAYYQESTSYQKPILQVVRHTSADYKYQNIYITSDEEIKYGDYWVYICPINGLDYGDNGKPIVKNNLPNSWFEKLHDRLNYKKIILTTDQDLIKDGVQTIDDDFLEWFIKNPNCEEVGIEKIQFNPVFDEDCLSYDGMTAYYTYKIIIPKEVPKQEAYWVGAVKWNDGTILKTQPFYQYDEGIKLWSSKFSSENKGKFEWINYERFEKPKSVNLEELAKDFYPNENQLMERIAFKRGYTECEEKTPH